MDVRPAVGWGSLALIGLSRSELLLARLISIFVCVHMLIFPSVMLHQFLAAVFKSIVKYILIDRYFSAREMAINWAAHWRRRWDEQVGITSSSAVKIICSHTLTTIYQTSPQLHLSDTIVQLKNIPLLFSTFVRYNFIHKSRKFTCEDSWHITHSDCSNVSAAVAEKPTHCLARVGFDPRWGSSF